MSSQLLSQMAQREISTAGTLEAVLRSAEALAVEAVKRADGSEVARWRAFSLSVAALAAANSHRATVWGALESASVAGSPSPEPQIDFRKRIADAKAISDLAEVVDEAEIDCSSFLARGLAGISEAGLRLQVTRAVSAIGEGLALTRSAVDRDPAPWSGIPV